MAKYDKTEVSVLYSNKKETGEFSKKNNEKLHWFVQCYDTQKFLTHRPPPVRNF